MIIKRSMEFFIKTVSDLLRPKPRVPNTPVGERRQFPRSDHRDTGLRDRINSEGNPNFDTHIFIYKYFYADDCEKKKRNRYHFNRLCHT